MFFKKFNWSYKIDNINIQDNYTMYGETIQGKFRGITYSKFTANNTDQFYEILPLVYRKYFSISLMQVSWDIPPHIDFKSTAVINFYINTKPCITQFYSIKFTDDYVNQNSWKGTRINNLTPEDSFIAQSGDTWILDVSKPHSVTRLNAKEDLMRTSVSLSTSKFTCNEVADIIRNS